MNKSTIIGFVLIGAILFGFSFYQSKQAQNQVKKQQIEKLADAVEATADDAASVKVEVEDASLAQNGAEASQTGATEAAPSQTAETAPANRINYKDSCLNAAAVSTPKVYRLSNDKIQIDFTTRGAQPYAVRIKDYHAYNDTTDLTLVRPGNSRFGIDFFVASHVNTCDFVFDLAEIGEDFIVMRLPFENGGYIEQKYTLSKGSYMVQNELSFVGLKGVIPNNYRGFNASWTLRVPRLEKGYKNEKQYSKMDYFVPGEKSPDELGRGSNEKKNIKTSLSWVAFHQQFFSAIVRAKDGFSSTGDTRLAVKFYEANDKDGNLMRCEASSLGLDIAIDSDNVTVPMEFYFGPNHYQTLKSYGQKYEKTIPLGSWIVNWVSRWVIIPCFNFLGRFISNYGIIILLMTILIKLLISPLTIKSYKSSAKMNVLKPEIEKINQKYPNKEDAMKKQQATMNLYKRAGVSPMGGCLPMLLQFPILFAMFRFFPASIELRQQHFLWAEDLSAYDSILSLPFGFMDHISLFALLMAVSMFIYSKMTSGQMSNEPGMAGMKFMTVWLMPIMMFFICNSLSSALSYYYLLSNLITMLQTWIIKKYFVDEKKILAQVAASEGKPLPKSKWQKKLEELQKQQEQAMREQQKRRK